MHVDSWLLNVLAGLASGLLAQASLFLAKNIYKLVKEIIRVVQDRQKPVDLLDSYADLEELLGDFLEKYRGLHRKTPLPTRWGFFYSMSVDIVSLVKGLAKIALERLLDSDETPRA